LVHVRPASTVAASVVRGGRALVCVPITNPCVAETKVTDAGLNPASETEGDGVGATTGGLDTGGVDGDSAGADDAACDDTAAGDDAVVDDDKADDTGADPFGVA
jgi:hypothetical protein